MTGSPALGHTDALPERKGTGERKGEVADYPAIGLMVIENKRVTTVLAIAASVPHPRGEERIKRGHRGRKGAPDLSKTSERWRLTAWT